MATIEECPRLDLLVEKLAHSIIYALFECYIKWSSHRGEPNVPVQARRRVSADVAWNRLLGLTEVFKVVHPTLDNILFHTRWNQWLTPVLSNKILDIFCSLPARNHYIFVRRPFCRFSNAYRSQSTMGLDERDGDFVKTFLKGCSEFRFDLNPENSGYHATTPCGAVRLLSPTVRVCGPGPGNNRKRRPVSPRPVEDMVRRLFLLGHISQAQ